MSRKKVKIHYFVLTEIVMAMGLMVLLYVCYFASTKTIDKMDRAFTNDARALQTVSNTVERLDNKKNYNGVDVKKIFMDEFSKSGFAKNSQIVPHVRINSESTTLALFKKNGKAIVEVQIKCQK
jgi:hypothetical protein